MVITVLPSPLEWVLKTRDEYWMNVWICTLSDIRPCSIPKRPVTKCNVTKFPGFAANRSPTAYSSWLQSDGIEVEENHASSLSSNGCPASRTWLILSCAPVPSNTCNDGVGSAATTSSTHWPSSGWFAHSPAKRSKESTGLMSSYHYDMGSRWQSTNENARYAIPSIIIFSWLAWIAHPKWTMPCTSEPIPPAINSGPTLWEPHQPLPLSNATSHSASWNCSSDAFQTPHSSFRRSQQPE